MKTLNVVIIKSSENHFRWHSEEQPILRKDVDWTGENIKRSAENNRLLTQSDLNVSKLKPKPGRWKRKLKKKTALNKWESNWYAEDAQIQVINKGWLKVERWLKQAIKKTQQKTNEMGKKLPTFKNVSIFIRQFLGLLPFTFLLYLFFQCLLLTRVQMILGF